MIEQEQVQVTQADRDAAEALRGSPAYALGFYDHTPLVQAFARHRHTATAEALESMREAREVMEDCLQDKIVDPSILVDLRCLCVRHGYGNVMSSASGLWRQALGDLTGGEFVAGPCRRTAENLHARLTAAIAKIEGEQP